MAHAQGFEQGPIRPPSEAQSLLLRLTRNCPWNRCTFCSVYKKHTFSLRPVADILDDLDVVHRAVQGLQDGEAPPAADMAQAWWAARQWLEGGLRSVFLQDADSLVMKPKDLITVLRAIRERFPQVQRITSYARSSTIARISDEHLAEMAAAGLNRIHIGLETAADGILQRIKKGVSKEVQIRAGVKARQAGMEVSEYILTGIGGNEFWREHALETADALNRINPHFIRFRTLRIADGVNLFTGAEGPAWERSTDLTQAREIHLLLENLAGISSRVKSDHMFNLFQEIDGELPGDRERLLAVLQRYFDMPAQEQALYQVGKRLQYFWRLDDMQITDRRAQVEEVCRQLGITPGNVDAKINGIIQEGLRRGMSL